MWILLDEMTFWMMFMMSLVGIFLFIVMLFVWLKMPKSGRTIVLTWLLKGVITIEATAHNTLRFVKRENTPNGLRAKIGKQVSVKTIPKTTNPILSSPAFLEGTGIPVYFASEDLALALTPTSTLATQIAVTPDKTELSKDVKEWAKKVGVPLDKLEDMLPTKQKPQGSTEEINEMLPLDLRNISKLSLFNVGDLEAARRNMLEHEHMEGKREGLGERSRSVQFAPLLIILVAVMGIALLLLYFAGPGALGF